MCYQAAVPEDEGRMPFISIVALSQQERARGEGSPDLYTQMFIVINQMEVVPVPSSVINV